jgi:hypothetical protein
MYCKHNRRKELGDYGFCGPVAEPGNENPAAHGCVCVEEECVVCGARRVVNVNGRHREEGPWGPDRATRQVDARQKRALADRLIAAIPTLVHSSGATVRLDRDGMAVSSMDLERTGLPSAWLEAAREARRAVLEAERAEREL